MSWGATSRFRRYTPPNGCAMLDIEASPVAKPLLEAVDVPARRRHGAADRLPAVEFEVEPAAAHPIRSRRAPASPGRLEQGRGVPCSQSRPSTSTNAASCETEPGKGSTTGSPASIAAAAGSNPRRWPPGRARGDDASRCCFCAGLRRAEASAFVWQDIEPTAWTEQLRVPVRTSQRRTRPPTATTSSCWAGRPVRAGARGGGALVRRGATTAQIVARYASGVAVEDGAVARFFGSGG